MTLSWPITTAVCCSTDYGTTLTTSNGTTITSGAANTKGSYTQLVASTGHDAVGMIVMLSNFVAGGTELGVDIAVGGAGSEQVIISNIMLQDDHATIVNPYFPVNVPAGSRISARCQSTNASDTCNVGVVVFDGEFTCAEGYTVDNYGFLTASSHGTVVDPGATANTKGAWAQLTASTTADIHGLLIGIDSAGVTGSVGTRNTMLLDIGIGASGSEQVLIPNLILIHQQNAGAINSTWPDYFQMIPVQIPSGTRIAARCQSGLNTATQRTIGVSVYGVRA